MRLAALASLVALTGGVARADVVVSASVDRTQPHVNESFTYTLRAEGDVRGDPDASPLKSRFDVLQSTESTRIQIVNGQAAQVSEWIYQLMPRDVGATTIPPIEVAGSYSNAVDLTILPSTASSQAPSDIFMEVEADPTKAYVQSQIIYTMRLFIGIGTGRATVTPPEVSGGEAIVEKLGDDRQYQTTRGGRNFVVHERRYAVFPQKAGMLTLGPATFEAMIMPNRGFSRVQRFRSGTVQVTVQPAVPPPAGFPKAAWLPARRVKLAEKWSDDPAQLTVGVPVTRTLTVEAEGLLETQLPDLEVPKSRGIREYPDQPDLDREATADGLTARRTQRYAVLAQTNGRIELPQVELPWFDVAAGEWKVARTTAHTIDVAAGADTPAPPVGPAPQAAPVAAPIVAAPASVRSAFWPVAAALLGLGWLATAALWWRARRPPPTESGPPPAGTAEPTRRPANRRLQRELRAACSADDSAAARDLLLQWALLRLPDEPPRSLGALAERCPPGLAGAIRALEASLYGPQGGSWSGAALAAALSDLDSVRNAAEDGGDDDELLPLYR